MLKQNYHHGNLKATLIHKGSELLNEVGYDSFSMRKLANVCGVSHSAPYRHFKNKDELISNIMSKALENFNYYLKQSIKEISDPKEAIAEIGRQYVKFFVENPDYLKLLLLTNSPSNIKIENKEVIFNVTPPFQTFKKYYKRYLKSTSISESEMIIDIMSKWSTIHGITILLVKQNIVIEDNYMDYINEIIKKLL